MENKSSTSSRTPGDVESQPVAKKSRLVLKTIIYDESIANQWLDEPPLEVWDHHIIPLLSLRDLALARPVCTFFEAYWQDKFSNNVLPLRVGNDVATINDVMGVIEILSSRREYTKLNPLVVLLGRGEHQVTSSCTDCYGRVCQTTLGITCSNITFLGEGKDTTTILGGFGIIDFENITFKNMSVTNTSSTLGSGIQMSNAKVELFDVALKGCDYRALLMSGSVVVATRCAFSKCGGFGVDAREGTIAHFHDSTFESNGDIGLYGEDSATILHLHGEATAVHSNRDGGILIYDGKVLIHLPSHHNTSYNNKGEDRHTESGGTITNVFE
jgi:hypothetical protein